MNRIRFGMRLYRALGSALSLGLVARAKLALLMAAIGMRKATGWQPIASMRITGSFKGMGFSMMLGSEIDLVVLDEVFVKKEYQCAESATQDVRSILDIGANIGAASLYLAATMPEATVYALEADPVTFARLSTHVAGNPRIIPVNAAVTDTDGTVTLFRNESHLGTSLIERAQTVGSITVRAATVATLAHEHDLARFDLIKVDAEGAELKIIASLDAIHAPEILIGEFHYDLVNRADVATHLASRFAHVHETAVSEHRSLIEASNQG